MAYNLIAVLKDIATRIGNISIPSIGTNIDGVSNAITNKTIPDNKTNIDGVATAINNKSIPDPSTNITAVATAVDNLAGGKDLGDIETILTTMNGNIANLGSNHIVTINEAPGSSPGYYYILGNGNTIPLPNQAAKTSYTDTNNVGSTDVQGALDYAAAKCKKAPAFSNAIMQTGATKTITISGNKTLMLYMTANASLYKVTLVSGVYSGMMVDLHSAGDIASVSATMSGGTQIITITANATLLLSVIASDNNWTIA